MFLYILCYHKLPFIPYYCLFVVWCTCTYPSLHFLHFLLSSIPCSFSFLFFLMCFRFPLFLIFRSVSLPFLPTPQGFQTQPENYHAWKIAWENIVARAIVTQFHVARFYSNALRILQCNAMQCNAMQCNAMQCNAMQCNAMQCNAMQCNAMQYNAMQCNAIWFISHSPLGIFIT